LPAVVRATPDAVLRFLLQRVAAGDTLAGRVVLQVMLGRLVNDARRDPEHCLDDYVAQMWVGIATYPLHRRPVRIAANLALDVAKRVRHRKHPIPVDPVRMAGLAAAAEPAEPELLESVLVTARAGRLIDEATELTLRLVYQRGLRSDEAAKVLGVTPAAVRRRCRRAVQRLAANAGALAELVSRAEASYPQGLSTLGITTCM
jgi:DNA-directed RNA polymerase specialized sigma24 family protein